MRRLIACALAAVALFGASAASANHCAVSGNSSGTVASYNPFSATGLSQTSTLMLYRTSPGHGTTRKVNFILVRPSLTPVGIEVRHQGRNIVHSSVAGANLSVDQPPYNSVFYDYGGSGQYDSAAFPFQVVIPPGLDLRAGEQVAFDLVYVCTASGNNEDQPSPQTINRAFTLRISVLSALQASYVGAALDFGEIGDIDTQQAATRSAAGAVRVASSGPYYLSMSSANSYRMIYPGGDPTRSDSSVRYSVTFAGQTRSTAGSNYSPVYCAAAGIAGEQVSIGARLVDGGVGRIPSPDYRDTLTVTVTPAVALAWPPPLDCSAL